MRAVYRLPFQIPVGLPIGREGIVSRSHTEFNQEGYLPAGITIRVPGELHRYQTIERYGSVIRERYFLGYRPWQEGVLFPIMVRTLTPDDHGRYRAHPLLMKKGIEAFLRTATTEVPTASVFLQQFALCDLRAAATEEAEENQNDPVLEQLTLTWQKLLGWSDFAHNEYLAQTESLLEVNHWLALLQEARDTEVRNDLREGFLMQDVLEPFLPDLGEPKPDTLTLVMASHPHFNTNHIGPFLRNTTQAGTRPGLCLTDCTLIDYNPIVYRGMLALYDYIQSSPLTGACFTYILLPEQGWQYVHAQSWLEHEAGKTMEQVETEEMVQRVLELCTEYGTAKQWLADCQQIQMQLNHGELVVYFQFADRIKAAYLDIVLTAVCSQVLTHL